MLVVLNVVLSYAAWFAVAWLAAQGQFGLAVLPSVAAVLAHLTATPAGRRRREVLVAVTAIPLGFGVETLNIAAGATRYAADASPPGVPPAFMIGLWCAFATLINVSLAWLKDRLALAALLGALASGPSYFAGAKIGALSLGQPVWQSLAVIGLVWSVALPALLLLARRLDRQAQPRSWKKS